MAASQANASPISLVLQSLGLTREDLLRHSDQMRQFLTAEDANSLRVFEQDQADKLTAGVRPLSRTRSMSNVSNVLEPVTPIKSEPLDPPPPTFRHFDSMEAVMDRKRRQSKRQKKARSGREAPKRERSLLPTPPSPSPSHTGFSMDLFMQSRDVRRAEVSDTSELSRCTTPVEPPPAVPFTPQQNKYYRDHVSNEASSSRAYQATFSPQPESPTPSARGRQAGAQSSLQTPKRNPYYRSPLPASSPPPPSSPLSSPTKRIVNIVSSPGPMGPVPNEHDDDELPYTLPPPPYSSSKPDNSYAALVGQAILSSPDHRLTLQEIYEWITTVYPYFKRGETTWMNSIRHVLSTTAVFRKVVRERAIGRTLWAIWDEDLECFDGGGFRKQFCKDMVEQGKGGKGGQRKRPASAEDDSPTKKSKRPRKTKSMGVIHQPYILPSIPPSHSMPLFPPTRPTPHHQPYYENCFAHPLPAEIIFPPLPSSSNYHRVSSLYASSVASTSTSHLSAPPDDATDPSSTSPPPSSASSFSISAVPDLTPNRNSSSPPLLSEVSSANSSVNLSFGNVVITNDDELDDRGNRVVAEVDTAMDSLEPSITLLNQKKSGKAKGKQKAQPKTQRNCVLPPMPPSPTMNCRKSTSRTKASKDSTPPPPTRLSTPPRPYTPPRNKSLHLSPHKTPLSHKGLHMSPSPSLAHYKSNLDPPPPGALLNQDTVDDSYPSAQGSDNMRTPSRKRLGGSAIFPPVTPKRLVFLGSGDSPFRTPGSSKSHVIYDPHDPAALLDEELSRLGERGTQDSPAGLFGKVGLYESPSLPSPGKWARWW